MKDGGGAIGTVFRDEAEVLFTVQNSPRRRFAKVVRRIVSANYILTSKFVIIITIFIYILSTILITICIFIFIPITIIILIFITTTILTAIRHLPQNL